MIENIGKNVDLGISKLWFNFCAKCVWSQ